MDLDSSVCYVLEQANLANWRKPIRTVLNISNAGGETAHRRAKALWSHISPHGGDMSKAILSRAFKPAVDPTVWNDMGRGPDRMLALVIVHDLKDTRVHSIPSKFLF
jgi:hypothetical protein